MRAVAVALLLSALCRAEWIRADSQRIELFTDAGEKSARQLMTRFEQIRGIFRQAGIAEGPLRVRVFAFASVASLHRFRDQADGFYQSGADCDYIALHVGPEADRVAFHEYVHLVLKHSSIPLPHWFDEGTAEFYSNLEIEKDRLRTGGSIPSHLAILSMDHWLDAGALSGRPSKGVFYAESWALIHMLNLSPPWSDGLPRFVEALAQERAPEAAFSEAFGKTMTEALAVLPAYLKTMRPATVPAHFDPPASPEITRLASDAAALAEAQLALSMKLPELAATLISKIPSSAAEQAMRGAIALAADHREQARRHLDRAIELGSRDPALYFEYAMLERETGRPNADALRKVIQIDPDFADAQFLLGVQQTDDGSYVDAIKHLSAATRLRPHRSTYWHALGYAQAKSGDYAAAHASARRAIATAETDQEEQMATVLANSSGDRPSAMARPSVTTPPSWDRRKGDARVEGTLEDFDCSSDPPSLKIRDHAGRLVTLRLDHPTEVELVNAPQPTLQLSCGPLNLRVAVDYQRASGGVTRIEFRL